MHKVQPSEAYVEWVAVSANARGQGAGTLLMRWAKETALEQGAERLTLGVVNGNPAISLYERSGFVKQQQPFCETL
eukprot:CAMPEP_0204840072 /NCGR_PEP_ID=MMETSP1346-20131115/36311_1 /ASSEMBLY_ACC=CAM_ASM_000771 /TAXON_ID=215587 /ORGANISM="Aplanochytrium stocchinoi, Strain GSBS06" /LENGTH=75 /DNA_ID=CAMNT_0051977239 /DNA_START=237 /DNA_END=461 /DNA_ORIENTATION=-